MSDTMETSPRKDWAAPVVAPSMDLMWAYQASLPINLIATPRHQLQKCEADELLTDVINRNQDGFDYFPVEDTPTNASKQFVGLVELASQDVGAIPGCTVRDRMAPLCEDNLIGADASILSFVKDADKKPCRLVMAGCCIEGLVTLSDLQKFPVRIALFALVTQLEMTMTGAIRREFQDSTEWKRRLPAERCLKVEEKRSVAAKDDNWVDDLFYTEFADKKVIILDSGLFSASKGSFKSAMERAESLRNRLAHANEYASTREAALAVSKTVQDIENWIGWLNAWPSAGAVRKAAG